MKKTNISYCMLQKCMASTTLNKLRLNWRPHWSFLHVLIFFFSSCMFGVLKESLIRVLASSIFATPSATFELLSYHANFALHFTEAPSSPHSRTRPFNKLILDFLDIEVEQGEDSDRHDSLGC